MVSRYENLTTEQIRKIMYYEPETGIITRFDGRTIIETYGRYVMRIDGFMYKVPRLIWLYMTGEWPKNLIDHKDRDPSNNRWSNLREATDSQNHQNSAVRNSLGYKGIDQRGPNLFRARIYVNKERINLGNFRTKEEAAEAYRKAADKHFGEYASYD